MDDQVAGRQLSEEIGGCVNDHGHIPRIDGRLQPLTEIDHVNPKSWKFLSDLTLPNLDRDVDTTISRRKDLDTVREPFQPNAATDIAGGAGDVNRLGLDREDAVKEFLRSVDRHANRDNGSIENLQSWRGHADDIGKHGNALSSGLDRYNGSHRTWRDLDLGHCLSIGIARLRGERTAKLACLIADRISADREDNLCDTGDN
jgi:hypothetical protein